MKRILLLVVVLGWVTFGYHKTAQAKQWEPQPSDPPIRNADLHPLGASSELQRDFEALLDRTDEALWAGYSVPMVRGTRHICCDSSDTRHRVCHLETGDCSSYKSEEDEEQTTGRLLVMYRLADGEIQKIRTFSRDCELDAGGLPVYWWSSVNPKQSMDFLETHVRQQRSTKTAESAVQAIAHHAEPGADEMLEDFASDRREDVAEQAVATLERAVEEDPDLDVKKKAVFGLSQLPNDEGVPLLIDVAQTHRHPKVRKQAMFWLGQSGDPRALAFFEKILLEN
jgi:hypothetical protein